MSVFPIDLSLLIDQMGLAWQGFSRHAASKLCSTSFKRRMRRTTSQASTATLRSSDREDERFYVVGRCVTVAERLI